jgi:threonine dehydratase
MTAWPQRIAEAEHRIRSAVRETPVELAEWADCPGRVVLKLEHLQITGSFKYRGATNKIELLTGDQAAAGVITASNGNHGLAVATAARRRGVEAQVYVSEQVSPSKLQRIERCGATIQHAGRDPLDAELAARNAASKSGKVFISPYNDIDVIAGQGTVAVELQRQIPDVDAVFVAAGGGGLIGGIGAYLKSVSPGTEIVGCWPENSPVLYECMRAGSVIDVPEQPTLSESTAGGLEPGSVTLGLCRSVVDRGVLVSEPEILDAMRRVLDIEHWLIEGAAGVAVAAFLKESARYPGKTVVIVLCGRNISPAIANHLWPTPTEPRP